MARHIRPRRGGVNNDQVSRIWSVVSREQIPSAHAAAVRPDLESSGSAICLLLDLPFVMLIEMHFLGREDGPSVA